MERSFRTWNGLRVQCTATGERCRRHAPCALGKSKVLCWTRVRRLERRHFAQTVYRCWQWSRERRRLRIERSHEFQQKIKRAHILDALQRISREGVPPRRISRGYCLVKAGHHFPPKYTIALAHEIATGQILSSNEFSGGSESNSFLKARGFDVVECNCGCSLPFGPITSPSVPSVKKIPKNPSTRHSERCPECKIRVRELLERIYGTCLQNHRFSWPAHLSFYAGTSIFPTLRKVTTDLEAYRGFSFEDFVRTKMVAPCDFWVPNPGFIVEFDESQHFTSPRKLVLSAYPDDHPMGILQRSLDFPV